MDLVSFFSWGVILQAMAIVHFIRRRPDTFWIFVILMGGGLGAFIYIFMEVVPDAILLRGSLRAVPRRRRIRDLERAILDNPSVGNHEELADLYLEEGKFTRARELYDKVITPRTDSIDPFYRRGMAALALNDYPAAVADLEKVVAKDPKYDFHRAMALLAQACGHVGQPERAEALFNQATAISTSSETYYHYALFLASQQRTAEARDWAQRILAKKPTMPRYLQRRERPWFRRAKALLKQYPAPASATR